MPQVPKYLRMLKDVEFKGEVSFTEYYLFQKFLQENIEAMNKVIEEKGVITRKRLFKLIEEY